MTKLNKKLVTTALLVSSVSLASFSANANEVPFEKALANLVVAQGKAVIGELNQQLEKSIKQNLSKFSVEQTFEVITAPSEMLVKEDAQDSDNNNSSED